MEFQYQAADGQGNSVSGRISAASEREAARLLRQQDLVPITIGAAQGGAPAKRAGRISAQEKTLVVRELATLLATGVPLAEAVASIAEAHGDSGVGAAFEDVLRLLRGGGSLSDALAESRLQLPRYVALLTSAGELTGKLAQSLQSAAAQMEYEDRMRQEMRNALTYPAILVISGIGATLLVFLVVVPKFANLLGSANADVPALSRWVIGAGVFVKAHLLWVALACAAVIGGAVASLSNAATRARLFEFAARLPVIGPWLMESEIARWASMLGALLQHHVPIMEAMELARGGVRIGSLQRKLTQAQRDLRGGKKLADALSATGALQSTGINLIRVGERSGELATMLRALAELYENAGRNRMKRFLLLLEPMAILLIGGVIGVIMIAIMLAITSLNNIQI